MTQEEFDQEQIDENRKRIAKSVSEQLGSVYARKSFENYTDEYGFIEKIKRCIDSKKSVYIFGDSRTGKTHIAAGIMFYLADKKTESSEYYGQRFFLPHAVKCISLDILISNIQNDRRLAEIDKIKKQQLLILDDIGVGKLTPERQAMYYYIIDYRISNGLQTIYTSNYKTNELWNGQNDEDPKRLITRIREMCEGIEIKKSGVKQCQNEK